MDYGCKYLCLNLLRMPRKKKDSIKKKDPGVLYIRYDKNTLCGQVVERLKRTSEGELNRTILNLIFLSEIVEPLNWHGIDLETLNHAYYESLRLFSDKLNQANFKINNLTSHIIRQKYREANSSLAIEDDKSNPLIFEISESQSEN